MLERFPAITEPGGGLYPPVRSEACWRDFCAFLQVLALSLCAKKLQRAEAKREIRGEEQRGEAEAHLGVLAGRLARLDLHKT